MIILHKYFISQSKNPEIFWNNIKKTIENYSLSATFLGRDVPQDLKKEYKKTYFAHYNKPAYSQMRSDYNKEKTNTLLLYLLLIYGFNRILRFNSKGDFNLPVGNVDFNANTQRAITDYFLFVADKNIHFFNMDFEKFLNKSNPSRDDFVYLDPPYLITFSEYNKLWNEESEQRLIGILDNLNEAGIRFAVSNVLRHRTRYNGIFNKWAQKYNIVRIKSNYISFNDNTEKDTYEVLIKNY
jgi:DNA adenine methylase